VNSYRETLLTGIENLNLSVSEQQLTKMLQFIKLIEKWNKVYNLTAIRKLDDMVYLHLLDSLAVLPHINGRRVIDVGTGAGLPGMVLAVCLPETDFVLLDSNAKKTRFVQQAILELGLKNVTVCQSRVQDYLPEQGFDTIITRAFAALADIIVMTAHLLNEGGEILAMKAQQTPAELALIAANTSVIPINIPGIEVPRCLVKIQLGKGSILNG
jgi:16S rRNA (guanine527-N7)-methyltransferase